MRVLIIKLNPFLREGITNVIMNLYRAMDKSDMHIDMAAVFPPELGYTAEFRANGGNIFVLERSMRHPLRYVKALARLIREGNYDLVHAHGNSATLVLEMLAAKKAGCKVRIAHSHNTTCNYQTVHRLLKGTFRATCTHRLACGEAAGKWLHGEKSFRVVNNGVDTAQFAFCPEGRETIRKQYGFGENEIVIGHVGRFNKAKNQSFLLNMLQKLASQERPYRLMLVGDGELKAEMEQKAESLGLKDKVIFAGETDRVGDYLSACDLIAMPSLFEGLPLSLIEAQANGLHCVVSDNITREVDKTGNLVFLSLETGAAHWAEQIKNLQLPTDRKTVSHEAVEKIKACGYDIHTEAANLKEYYRRAVERETKS